MTVHPDRLHRQRHAEYLPAIKVCLRSYRDGAGRQRRDLHRAVEETLSRLDDCPPRRIAAFCKLLDDGCEYASDRKAARELRRRVFEAAAPLHPIVFTREGIFEHDIESARAQVARKLGMKWSDIEAKLFADVIECQRLVGIEPTLGPSDLLRAYNMAQTQAALYRATAMRIEATRDLKTIIRHVKLAGLMHHIEPIHGPTPGYRFHLDGPGSKLRTTTRYGVRFASLLPMLLACRDWRLSARIPSPRGDLLRLVLSSRDRLRSPHPTPPEHDSQLEVDVEEAWKKNTPSGWTLSRESALLSIGQTVFTPDFVLTHTASGARIYLEIVGFWTPEYLNEKARKLSQFRNHIGPNDRWLLMVPRSAKDRVVETFADIDAPIISFERRGDPQEWIRAAH